MNSLIIYAALSGVVGIAIGFLVRKFLGQKAILEAETKHKELIISAKDEALKIKEKAKKELEEKEKYLQEIEINLRRREESLDKRTEALELDKTNLEKKAREIDEVKEGIKKIKKEEELQLAKVAKLSKEEARDEMFKLIEKEYHADLVDKIKQEKAEAKEEAEREGMKIIAAAIQRLATDQTAEMVINNVVIPSEEMKGRIIGKEGRNIQVFEKVTGVDLIIDDTPDMVMISCFDPIRRHVAKIALETLISDGRINPTRIEEVVAKANEEIAKEVKEAGEAAAYEVGLAGLHPDLIKVLGRLKFRTSYGQNVLKHSIESAHIASMIAADLKADINIVKKAALLHDIGKAVDHDVPGTHASISCDIARKYGMSEAVIHAIEAHHEEVDAKSVEAIIVRVSDAISGARPGARRESYEAYVKRLTELENITNSFKGVDKSYAIQAGREVRIIVRPEEIDDLSALKLAKDIAQKIETNLQYPGTIKVNVIREIRASELAK